MHITRVGVRALSLGALLAATASLPTQAAAITFNYTESFGTEPPVGPSPYATSEIVDSGVDTVTLTMQVSGFVGAADVTGMYFNLDPALDPTLLTFTRLGGTGPTAADTTILTGVDAYRADGDGFYDILFDFPPPPGGDLARFNSGESLIYEISMPGLSAASFNFFGAPGPGAGNPGPFLSVARFQETGPLQDGSDWVGAVPVPAAVWLFGSGLLGLVGLARRRSA